MKWNRENQVILTLRRDLLVDFYNSYKNSPFYCEKGLVPYNDPYIFAQEIGEYNQIKKYEYSLEAGVGGPWMVLYFSELDIDKWAPLPNGSSTGVRTTDRPIVADDPSEYWNLKTWDTNKSYVRNTLDAPYQVVIIPAFNATFYNMPSGQVPGDVVSYTSSMDKALAIASGVANIMGSGSQETGQTTSLIDIQILPYCPTQYFARDTQGRIILSGITVEDGAFGGFKVMDVVPENGGNVLGQIYFIERTMFQFTKTLTYPYMNVSRLDALTEAVKEDSNLRFVRLCSNNGASIFQYNQAKIADLSSVASARKMEFTIKCTYKPITPQIQIYPKFQGLYGSTFSKDQRGIFFQGDYSIPLNTDAWLQYITQNKNYQQIFDRQIDNMEANYKIEREQMKKAGGAGIAGSVASGAGSGALIGSAFGPIGTAVGAGVGALVGGISSAFGMDADLDAQKAMHNEAVDFARDQFASEIGNIKAIPNTLSNVGTYGLSAKDFPYVEIYSCTDQELTAFRNKITYNGFSIGRVGTVQEFKTRADSTYTSYDTKYVKGQLIRCDSISEDTHTVNEIANELYKGVFFV